ncbi:MAG: TolC family protein [Nitrospirae bacterium]|nr:MAG: TolC family protein [Nitrospirota bacterium]
MRAGHGSFVVFCMLLLIAATGRAPAAELKLADGLRRATDSSRLLKIALHEEEIFNADAAIEKARMLPAVNAGFGGTLLTSQPAAIFGPNTVPLSQKDFLAYSLSIQQTLYDFRGNASRYEASRIRADAKRLDTERLRNLVAVDFALTYLDLLEAQKLMTVAEKEVERLGAHGRDVRTLYEEGVVTKNDLLQAEVRLSDARQRLLGAANLRSVHASRLNNLLNNPLEEPLQPAEVDLTSMPAFDMPIGQIWQLALEQRAELRILKEIMAALDLEETARRSEYFPRLFVKGGYDFTENRYQVHEGNWSVTLGLGISLYSGGTTRAELLKIGSQRARLIGQRDKLVDDIKLEIKKYLLDSVTARERMKVTAGAVGQAEENLRINRSRYEEGVGTATEVLDAVALLSAAETNYFKSLYDAKKAEAAVLYAVGQNLLEVYK